MKDHIIRQAYDKGYDAGARAAQEPAYVATNPYKKTHGWGYSRFDYWEMGVNDGWKGKPRKLTQGEADAQAWAIVRQVAKMDGVICLCGSEHGADCLVKRARAIAPVPAEPQEANA